MAKILYGNLVKIDGYKFYDTKIDKKWGMLNKEWAYSNKIVTNWSTLYLIKFLLDDKKGFNRFKE